MRACPHCSHEIQEEATKCRHCKRVVEPPMWLSSMRRCPYCAEWIERDRTKCPHCDSAIDAAGPQRMRPEPEEAERTAPFVESSLDDLVGGLRREAESGPELRDDLGKLGRAPDTARRDEPERRNWQADLAALLGGGLDSWEAEFASEPAGDEPALEDVHDRTLDRQDWETEEPPVAGRRSWEAEEPPAAGPRSGEAEEQHVSRRVWQPDLDRPESRRGWAANRDQQDDHGEWASESEAPRGRYPDEPALEPEVERAGLHRSETAPEPKAAETAPKERRLGPFRLGRKKPKEGDLPGGPEPLFASAAEEARAAVPIRVEEDEQPGYTALPPSRLRETSSFPQLDREALLSEEGRADGRGRRLAGALGRTLIALLVVGGLGMGGFLLVRGPGAPLLARLLAPSVPAPSASPEPTSTLSRAPTLPPETPVPGSTSEAVAATEVGGPEGCVLWDQVTLEDEGERMCVYGEIRRWFAVDEVPFVAIFSEEAGTFALVDRSGVHDVGPGDCVMGSGLVEVMRGTRPNIDVQGNLMPCPSG